jgi:3,4-dihydroxy 2-butanone 4-phosphate synthase/GTP cyclohydrolase II
MNDRPHSPDLADAAAALTDGALVIVTDGAALNGAGRGFFLHAAALATTDVVATAILHGRGITCFSVTPAQAMRLGLTLAAEFRPDRPGPVFLRSVEAAECDGTGISAEDRALTLRAAGAPDAGMASLKSPGHVVPALVTDQPGPGEVASAARAVLTRLSPHEIAAWTDILDDDGELAGSAWCRDVAEKLVVPHVELARIAQ